MSTEIYDYIVEMAGGSTRELAALLTRLRDVRPEMYRAFTSFAAQRASAVRKGDGGACSAGSRGDGPIDPRRNARAA
jgi:hypothetical protein